VWIFLNYLRTTKLGFCNKKKGHFRILLEERKTVQSQYVQPILINGRNKSGAQLQDIFSFWDSGLFESVENYRVGVRGDGDAWFLGSRFLRCLFIFIFSDLLV